MTLALLQRLAQGPLSVYPFKAGPDFIDPVWHQKATGKTSYNLDSHMMTGAQLAQTLNHVPENALALVEGVMGLFDGRSGVGGAGSTLDLAEKLNAPVLLVVNAKGLSGSIVPLVAGFQQYANRLGVNIVGILANQVGSAHHIKLLKGHLADEGLPPIIATLDKHAPSIAERHLGLNLPGQEGLPDFGPHLELDEPKFMDLLGEYTAPAHSPKPKQILKGKQIAIAKDQASCFIYPANLDWLQEMGAEISYFSILQGEPVPANTDALWLPGGYPELYGTELSASKSWDSINQFIDSGGHALAECGGMMMLGQSCVDLGGNAFSVSGLLPYQTKMEDRLVGLGYRELQNGMKGHEFHHSSRQESGPTDPAFELARGDQGIKYKNLIASYIHWYFPSNPSLVASWFAGEAV